MGVGGRSGATGIPASGMPALVLAALALTGCGPPSDPVEFPATTPPTTTTSPSSSAPPTPGIGRIPAPLGTPVEVGVPGNRFRITMRELVRIGPPSPRDEADSADGQFWSFTYDVEPHDHLYGSWLIPTYFVLVGEGGTLISYDTTLSAKETMVRLLGTAAPEPGEVLTLTLSIKAPADAVVRGIKYDNGVAFGKPYWELPPG